ALALRLRRERAGPGGSASISQAAVMLSHLAADIAAVALQRGGDTRSEQSAPNTPWGVFPADGEDNWVTITVRDDADWRALSEVVGLSEQARVDLHTASGRQQNQQLIDDTIRAWTVRHSRTEVMEQLQAAGVPAAAVLHPDAIPSWV